MKHTISIKRQIPESFEIEKPSTISFSFKLLNRISYSECKDPKFFVCLLERLKKLSSLTWNDVSKSDRHTFGYEKIPAKQIKKVFNVERDIDYLYSFRATGDKHVFLGFREGNIFNVIFIEARFGDIYSH